MIPVILEYDFCHITDPKEVVFDIPKEGIVPGYEPSSL
jgi:hypothetical protein